MGLRSRVPKGRIVLQVMHPVLTVLMENIALLAVPKRPPVPNVTQDSRAPMESCGNAAVENSVWQVKQFALSAKLESIVPKEQKQIPNVQAHSVRREVIALMV